MSKRGTELKNFIGNKNDGASDSYANFENTNVLNSSNSPQFIELSLHTSDGKDSVRSDNRKTLTSEVSSPSRAASLTLKHSGTIGSSTTTLVSTSLGVGVLALPYAMHQAGLLNGVVALVAGGVICWWFLLVLIEASYHLHADEFAETVQLSFGKSGAKLFQLFFIIYIIGCLINYQITTASFMTSLLVQMGFFIEDASYAQTNFTDFRVIVIVICNVLCIFPVSLAKSMYHLRHTTFLIVGVVIYTAIIVIVQAPSYIAHAEATHQGIMYYCFNPTIFSTFAVMVFAYNCNTNLFPIRMELASPTEDRMKKICNRTISVDILIYALVAVVAYVSFRNDTTPLITNRPSLPGMDDFYMGISRVLLCLSVMFSVAIRVHPCRQQIVLFFGLENHHNNCLHFLLTFMLVGISAVVAMIFPNVYDSFTILGGYGTTIIGIIIPGLVYLKSVPSPKPVIKIIVTCVLMIIGTVMGFTAATFTLLKQLDIYRIPPCEM